MALLSNVDGTYVGDEAWDPVFDELERRGAYVFLHPIQPATPSPMPQAPVWVQEFPFDTTRAVTNLIYSGTLARCPSIRLQLAHLGGTAPFIAHRIAEWAGRDPSRAAAAPDGALTYMRRMWFDTGLSNNPIATAAVRELAGVERIVFGTDWPYAVLPEGADPAPGPGPRAEDRGAGRRHQRRRAGPAAGGRARGLTSLPAGAPACVVGAGVGETPSLTTAGRFGSGVSRLPLDSTRPSPTHFVLVGKRPQSVCNS